MNTILIISTLIAVYLLLNKSIRQATVWRATVTPLASIIGSGFLVVAPLLAFIVGKYALLVITLFAIFAYFIGGALRYNIRYAEPILNTQHTHATWIKNIEWVSRFILGIAYIVSVVFYLKLLAAFSLETFQQKNIFIANSIVTLILLSIGIIGFRGGLSKLEVLEEYAVGVKLAIIFGFLLSLSYINIDLLLSGEWALTQYQPDYSFNTLKMLLGMLIIIQGFETSRFIGHKYSTDVRIKTMRYAQIISGVIYIIFIALVSVLFDSMDSVSETEIITMTRQLSSVLPYLLIIAAIMSQFSASIADTIGSGGLLSEASRNILSPNQSYLIIIFLATILTWSIDIFGIISLASRGFALYYALQCLIAAMIAVSQQHYSRMLFYICMCLLLCTAFIIGIPLESE